MFKLDGAEVTLTLFDVTGQDEVVMGNGEVRGDKPDIPILNLGPRVVRLPGGKPPPKPRTPKAPKGLTDLLTIPRGRR
jgi:hypothetical protein